MQQTIAEQAQAADDFASPDALGAPEENTATEFPEASPIDQGAGVIDTPKPVAADTNKVVVDTDTLHLTIDLNGGDIIGVELKNHLNKS